MISKKSEIKSFIKLHSSIHQPGKEKNIFLFSTPRSGSTWLTELVSTQPQFKMIKEPFNIRKDYIRENLKMDSWEEIIDPENKEKIKIYLNNFIKGKDRDLRFGRPAPFSTLWKPFTSRIIFKILFAGEGDFDWFRENFNGEIIFLIRHPVPVSLSREVYPRLTSFLKAPFCHNFSESQIQYAQDLISKKNPFDLAILDWCFQNALPLKQKNNHWLTVSYEQTVLQPEIVIENLLQKFHFKDPKKIKNRLNKASGSTVKSSEESKKILLNPEKLAKSKNWLVEKWKDKITEDQHKKAFEILETFEIDFYEYKNFLPNKKYLLD